MTLAFWFWVIGGVLYVLLNLDTKRNWAPWSELARLAFVAGLLAWLFGH